jgi:hypothetical protein
MLSTLEALPVEILYTSATLKGEISDMGTAPITNHGILLSDNSTPVAGNSQVSSLGTRTSKGVFQVIRDNLTVNTIYYYRAFVTVNGADILADAIRQFRTRDYTLPAVTTTSVSSVTSTSAISGGNVTTDGGSNVTARGVCLGTSSNPTVDFAMIKTTDGTGPGSFSSTLSGLNPSSKYYYRAYATNIKGTVYGEGLNFNTSALLPTVTTTTPFPVTATTAVSGGNITSDGGATVTVSGVCWSTSPNPGVSLSTKTTDGTASGSYTSNITGLAASTLYYLRAYATNSAGTGYGDQLTFTTSAVILTPPTAVSSAATSMTATTATINGSVNANGSSTSVSFEYGTSILYGSTANATPGIVSGVSPTSVYANLPGLIPGTLYHFRVKAVSAGGTVYSDDLTFTTHRPPSATTQAATNVTQTTATLNGIVNANGLSTTITFEHGTTIPYSYSSNGVPVNASGTTNTASKADITGLIPGTTYHFRIKAVSSAGTTYGDDMTFPTSAVALVVPTLTTTVPTSVTTTSASGGGTITSNGGAAITVSGVCWSTNSNPGTSLTTKTTDGTASGTFISSITGLNPGTFYYIRAYATNSVGTGYGSEENFTTSSIPPAAPSNLVANATNPATVSITWTDNSNNETGFEIQRQHTTLSTWVTVTTVGPNVTSFNHTGLSETWPGYQVKAINTSGSSVFSNTALAPAKLRIINNLYSTTPVSGNEWYKFNKIVRARFGPSYATVTAAGNTYEKLCPFDNLSESAYTTFADWINPAYNATTQYKDFPVSTYGYGDMYYLYIECGWWEYYIAITPPNYWIKRLSNILCLDGTCCCSKWAWTQITNHASGYFVLTATEIGLPYGSWNGTVKGDINEGRTFDAKAQQAKY